MPYWTENTGPSTSMPRSRSGTGTGAAAVVMFSILDRSYEDNSGISSKACSMAETRNVNVIRSAWIVSSIAFGSKLRCSTVAPPIHATAFTKPMPPT